MDLSQKRNVVFMVLAGFFITNAVVAELIGGKLISFFGIFTQSIGIILWPVVFVLTDLINEHYGRKGVRRLTYITVGLICYTYLLITIGINTSAVEFSPVNDRDFATVFGQSRWIIAGSVIAFLVSQLVDVYIFWILRRRTNGGLIWLRATGSTAVSQLIDTFLVQYIAFVLPGNWSMNELMVNAGWGYLFKLIIAFCMTPLIYAGHYLIKNLLNEESPQTT